MGWLSGYAKRYAIYANTSAIVADVTNEALPVFPSDLTGLCLANMNDAVFTGADGTTRIPHYWETKTLSAAVGHAKFPLLTAGQASTLVGYLYLGNPAASDSSDEAGTFAGYVARYALSEASGTIYDSTANGYDSVTNTMDYGATGQIGGATSFEGGTTDRLVTGTIAHNVGSGDFSWSLWVKLDSIPTANPGGGLLVSGAYVPCLYVARTTGALSLYWLPQNVTLGATLGAGAWHHVALVRTVGTCYGYVDGAVGSSPRANSNSMANAAFAVAAFNAASGGTLAGDTDDVRFGAMARSASSIKAEYLAGAGTLFAFGAMESFAAPRRGGHPQHFGPSLLPIGGA